ncbi:MAG: sugar ABC transporter permease [Clostridia bacterium]|nr:sugar ABC transporter permease [Clostridia bacterium]
MANKSILKKKKWKEEAGWFVFILPLVIGLLVFSLYPMVMSLFYSFFEEYDGRAMIPAFSRESWVFPDDAAPYKVTIGNFTFKNYLSMFDFSNPDVGLFNGYDMLESLGMTFLYAFTSVPGCLILSFGVALLVNTKIKGVGIFRTLYYLPVIIPSVIWGLLWASAFSNLDGGLFNTMLRDMGLPKCQFFLGEDTAFPTFLSLNLWTLGASMILWLSALKNVPESLIEAAKLDGAGYFRRVVTVIIPMCSSILFYNMITGVIGALQMMGNVKALVSGAKGAEQNLPFYALQIYNNGFGGGQTRGLACAMAWVLFVIIGLLTGLIFKSSGWVYYGDGGKK